MNRTPSIKGLSPSAARIIKSYIRAVSLEDGLKDPIPCMDSGGSVYGAGDVDVSNITSESPPQLGFSSRLEVSPERIEVIDGVEIVFQFSDSDRTELSDSILDYRGGIFVYVRSDDTGAAR